MNADMKWLDNPEVFKVNQLEPHSDHCYYLDYSDMKKEKNPLLQSLNGQWEFAFSKNVMERPVDFYKETFDASGLDKIMVPGHIELAGYDKIRYINTMYPWEGKEYHRGAYSMEATGAEEGMFSEAQYNPVGSYIKYFDLDKNMCGKRIHICFEGVEEAMYLWLNGQFIGYAEDSFTPSEFDLTPYIKEKGNVLAVQVHKMSTAAFLEDQDFFRFFGIFRNVTLKAIPDVHLEDVWFKPVLNQDNESGSVSVSMKVSATDSQNVTAGFILKDREENILVEKSLQLNKENDHLEGTICVDLESVRLWDNHNPYLYHAYVELKAEDGSLAEVIPYDIGFRRIEIIDKVVYLNGKRLVITGVNRHEWNARTGRCIGIEDMKADISCMLRNNINSVRTCHYPDQIPWYYMCDDAGIYVMAETNLESHGSFQKLGAIEPSCNVPGSIPQWRDAVLERAKNNFETFKNHTSILFWSLGNESYAGDDIEAMNVYFAEKQDGRLVHYESAYYNRAYEDTISDFETRMYAKPEDVEEYLNNSPKKPYILCEFMHDMGNSMGGLGSYMKLIDKYDMYHGGFIWDFIDQAIMVKDPVTGKDVLRYGGDFDDRASDYEFCTNGIVYADRKISPKAQEVKQLYANVKLTPDENGVLIKNENLFISTEAYTLVYRMMLDGYPVFESMRNVVVQAQEEQYVKLDYPNIDEPGEYTYEVAMELTEDTIWADAGHEICFGQFVKKVTEEEEQTTKKMQVIYGDVNIGVKGEGFLAMFSKSEGGLASLQYDGTEYITRAPKTSYWRACTDNDRGAKQGFDRSMWLTAGLYQKVIDVKVEELEEGSDYV